LNPSKILVKPYKYPLKNEERRKDRDGENMKKHIVKRSRYEGSRV
jgi:hypothetical protein